MGRERQREDLGGEDHVHGHSHYLWRCVCAVQAVPRRCSHAMWFLGSDGWNPRGGRVTRDEQSFHVITRTHLNTLSGFVACSPTSCACLGKVTVVCSETYWHTHTHVHTHTHTHTSGQLLKQEPFSENTERNDDEKIGSRLLIPLSL